MSDLWKPALGFEDYYEVSTEGVVRRLFTAPDKQDTWRGAVLKARPRRDGYLHVRLSAAGIHAWRPVHRLVAESFLGPRPLQMTVNHIDGNKLNNAAVNLEWLSMGDNIRHAFGLGLYPRQVGETNPNRVLTECAVRIIRRLLALGFLKQREIATVFGVHRTTINDIARGKQWKHQVA